MDIEQLARKGIMNLPAYIPGKGIEEVEKEFGVKRWVKLASNENLLGPSPKAMAAIRKELSSINFYPEGPCTVLIEALARKFSVSEKTLIVSNGADNLILMVANAFVDEGDEVVMADPTFPVYANTTQIMGGTPVKLREKDFRHDLPAMLERITSKTKLIFICNPNNPSGTIVSQKALDDFLSKLPERVILILDEAYCDFSEDPHYPDGLDYVKAGKQLIVLRTFSKVYGLAGLRLGFAAGREDLIRCLYQVRDPFPVHRLAHVAGVAALNDSDHERKSVRLVHEGRRYLYKELDKMGLFHVPSEANFILIDLKRDSREIFEALLREGVIIRPGFVWKYETFARVTIGRMSDNRRFIQALKKILKGNH
ncbi:MAG: histidinol-phosphate transaminase [Deltaproteobacteria bacterium RBG_13_52_11b]|nr:MAG: histidinol-phosphate transaminase [Deltaproteobacteria bacterium RBG_13_52_11b]